MHSLIVIIAVGLLQSSADAASWSYEGETGPEHWVSLGYESCGGSAQSPIDLSYSSADKTKEYDPIEFESGYSTVPTSASIQNNGHAAQVYDVTVSGDNPLTFTSGPFGDDVFKFQQLHFHWGKDSSVGSEHTLDGKRFPLEMHMVHYNTKYDSLDTAAGYSDGLAVIGMFFEESDTDNEAYAPIVAALSSITEASTSTSIENPPALSSLFPKSYKGYFTYEGSLTTPGCNEAARFLMIHGTVSISAKQLEAFRSLVDSHGNALVDNFRPVQETNGRTVNYFAQTSSNDA